MRYSYLYSRFTPHLAVKIALGSVYIAIFIIYWPIRTPNPTLSSIKPFSERVNELLFSSFPLCLKFGIRPHQIPFCNACKKNSAGVAMNVDTIYRAVSIGQL
jgi:hypothetical protein